VAGVATRIFTAGDGFHTGGCSLDNLFATTISRLFRMIATTFFLQKAGLKLMRNLLRG
jgi:hypothetical protein